MQLANYSTQGQVGPFASRYCTGAQAVSVGTGDPMDDDASALQAHSVSFTFIDGRCQPEWRRRAVAG